MRPDHSAVRDLHIEQIEDLIKLQKAAQKISSILNLDELIDKIVNEVAQSFGCLEATIYLHDETNAELVLTGVCGCTVHGKGSRKRVTEGMTGHVAITGKMHYAPDVRVDPYYIACEPSTLSEVAVPLHVEGKLVGVFSTSHHELDAFPPAQLRLLQGLCKHIAVAIHSARRYGQERQERERMSREAQEARAIQQALLPKVSPYVPGFAISGLSIPAGEVGGDWYDFIPFADGCWGLVLADVSGKGTAAALLMSATRGMLRSLAVTCGSPAEVLGKLNRLMVEDFPPGRFVTLIYAVLDPANRTLTFASAGHLPPLLVDDAGSRFLPSEQGTPLGLVAGEFSETTVELREGSRLLFYSDGITEAAAWGDQEYGPRRLQSHLLNSDATTESILADVRVHVDGAGLQDDATVILLRA
jgi:sigma-B regulation protein RsbU (phosphoserine phosphatase)